MSYSEDIVRVHLENPESINVQKTEEKEPEHFTFGTRVVANATGYDSSCQLLAEDPLRKDWSVTTLDQPIILCHSPTSAANAANQINTVAIPPMGAIIAAGAAFSFTGTGGVWIAATSATPTRVSFAVNRRGSA